MSVFWLYLSQERDRLASDDLALENAKFPV